MTQSTGSFFYRYRHVVGFISGAALVAMIWAAETMISSDNSAHVTRSYHR